MVEVGRHYPTNHSGELLVTKYVNAFTVTVLFPTGFSKITRSDHILSGKVRDPYAPSLYGVGFIGVGKYLASKAKICTPAYERWSAMLQRCYSPLLHEKFPTYTDCTVAKEWHNFQIFAEWYYANVLPEYELDKDILVDGNKVYSQSTCLFVSTQKNTEKACAKNYIFVSPEGVITHVYNLTKFGRDNDLRRELLGKVHRRERKHHKGWTKYE